MKPYTQTYINFFGYTIADFIPCECCGGKAVDIHHIEARSKRKDLLNDIINLMALCRLCHIKYGDKIAFKDFLQEIHNKKIENK